MQKPHRYSHCIKTYYNTSKTFPGCRIVQIDQHITTLKEAKKELNKSQHSLMTKSFDKLIKEENIKSTSYGKPYASGETKNQVFVLKSEIK